LEYEYIALGEGSKRRSLTRETAEAKDLHSICDDVDRYLVGDSISKFNSFEGIRILERYLYVTTSHHLLGIVCLTEILDTE
jgi:hypothetical protein